MNTKWNGEPCEARIVNVVVGASLRDTWWCADMAGQTIEAVEVTYGGQTFYLNNEDGSGWYKVTNGGHPGLYHASVPVERVLEDNRLLQLADDGCPHA